MLGQSSLRSSYEHAILTWNHRLRRVRKAPPPGREVALGDVMVVSASFREI